MLSLFFYHNEFLLKRVGFSRLTCLERIWPCTSIITDFSLHETGFHNLYVSGAFGFVPLS